MNRDYEAGVAEGAIKGVRIMHKLLVVSIATMMLFLTSNLWAKQEQRLALLIGNSNYIHGGILNNPVNDVRAVERALEELGFTVIKYEDCSQKAMKRAMDRFGRKLKGKDVGLFFYAGHGVQVDGHNYLLPIDAKLDIENDAEYDCVRTDRILAKMEEAGSRTNIVILDACRDNPFERSWRRSAKGEGLAFMNAPSGSLIAYSTSPGKTALDGAGPNSTYTSALLEHIATPGITVLKMFQKVRSAVMFRSGNKQIPWESTSLKGDFYFENARENADAKYPEQRLGSRVDLNKKNETTKRPKVMVIDGQFIAYADGTVLDKNTGLMWADVDNRANIDWHHAKIYCETYQGGGHKNWRMPTSEELCGLCDARGYDFIKEGFKPQVLTKMIYLSKATIWTSEAPGDSAVAAFSFYDCHEMLIRQSNSEGFRALPVRNTERYNPPIVKPIKSRRFILVQSSIVYDTKTGLEWKVGPDKDTTWEEASSNTRE